MFLFFFSSRRRHTIWPRDWSSDVCSSDLGNSDLLLSLARVAMVEPDYLGSAEEWLRQCEPEPRVWRALAECYQRQGLYEQANQALWKWHDSQQAAAKSALAVRSQTHPSEVAQG